MHRRLHPKPQKTNRGSRLDKFSGTLKRHDSLVLAASLVLTSAKAIAAAASAWFAWQQVGLTSRERSNALAAVSFQERIKAQQEILEAMADYELSLHRMTGELIMDAGRGVNTSKRRACLVKSERPLAKLNLAVRKNIAVWTLQARAEIANYAMTAYSLNLCASMMVIEASQTSADQQRCSISYDSDSQKFRGLGIKAYRAMSLDIAAISESER